MASKPRRYRFSRMSFAGARFPSRTHPRQESFPAPGRGKGLPQDEVRERILGPAKFSRMSRVAGMTADIILCGDQSTDRNCGETGGMLAELLGLPVVTSVVAMDVNIKENTATVSRRLERGARAFMRCQLPALFTTDIMLNEPRYPTLPGRKRAAGQEIRTVSYKDLFKGEGIPSLRTGRNGDHCCPLDL